MFDEIMDYEGCNGGFIRLLKSSSADLIVKVISEIEDGFVDGIDGVLPWIRAQVGILITAAAPPA